MTSIFKRKRKPLICVNCGRERIDWPREFTDEFYEANKCPSGAGHSYWDAPGCPPPGFYARGTA